MMFFFSVVGMAAIVVAIFATAVRIDEWIWEVRTQYLSVKNGKAMSARIRELEAEIEAMKVGGGPYRVAASEHPTRDCIGECQATQDKSEGGNG